MALIRFIGFALALSFVLTPASRADDSTFNQYFEGALKVYAQFKEPSKRESEQFFSFIKSQWESRQCISSCGKEGYDAGQNYANRMNVQMETE